MTDQKYKLVPVEPTAAMLQVGKHSAPYRAIDVYRAMIKVTPEPVCGLKFRDGHAPFWYSECGYRYEWISGGPMEWDFCPHCGKRVQLREEVDDD